MAMQGIAFGYLYFANCLGFIMSLILLLTLQHNEEIGGPESKEMEYTRHISLYSSFMGVLVMGALIIIIVNKKCQLDIN